MKSTRLKTLGLWSLGLVFVVLALGTVCGRRVYMVLLHPREFVRELRAPEWYDPADPVAEIRTTATAKIPNFGRVTEMLYRSGQPTGGGLAVLKGLGIQVVVDFQEAPDEIAAEKQAVESLGMRFVSIPWKAFEGPDNRQVAEFLAVVRLNPDKKIHAHCQAGRDRTGVMVAAYRMAVQNWTPQQALEEMEAFGFRHDLLSFWYNDLERYVREFPAEMSRDPNLLRFQHGQPPSDK